MSNENYNKGQSQRRQSQPPPNGKDGKGNKPKFGFSLYWVYGLVILIFIGMNFMGNFGSGSQKTNFSNLEVMLQEGDVAKIMVVNDDVAEITLKEEALTKEKYEKFNKTVLGNKSNSGPQFYLNIGNKDIFNKDLEKIQAQNPNIKVPNPEYVTRKNYFGDLFIFLLPIMVIVGIWIFMMRRMGNAGGGSGQIFNIGKSKAKLFDRDNQVNVNFDSVAGLEEAKVELKEIVDFLKSPAKYTDLGAKIPKGALLVGPPGTGKTLLAKAVAGEAQVPFFSLSGSDFVEMFVGVGASRVRDLFKQAKEKAPVIIFIDEIDAIGRARGKSVTQGANDERENTLNQLLTEMDGFEANAGIIILAATNRADILDKALLRPGRFDRQIYVDLPDLEGRKEIFKVHLRPLKKLAPDVDVELLAKQTPGFSGADIANVCNEAALIAARKSRPMVTKQDFHDAIDRVIGGLEKKTKLIAPKEKRTIAFHEAGHATVSWLLEHASPLVKVTIIPRGQSLGAAWYLPEERQITTTEQLLDEMCATLGGRAAEEIMFGKISTGALSDLEKVTKQAYAMVSIYGLNDKIGNISFYDSTGQTDFSISKPYSEKTAEIIDAEVKAMVELSYNRAKQILVENREKLILLADRLLERELLFREDLVEIFGERTWDIEKEKEYEMLKAQREQALKDEERENKAEEEARRASSSNNEGINTQNF